MPCTPFSLAGATGILCSRTRRPRCACGQPAGYQCDAPSKRKSGTCDKHLCAACATEVGPDKHLCRAHAEEQCAKTPAMAAPDLERAATTGNGLPLEWRLFALLVELGKTCHISEKGITGEAMSAVRAVLQGAPGRTCSTVSAPADRLSVIVRLREAVSDLLSAQLARPSCQAGAVRRCMCLKCATERAQRALSD